MKNLRNVIASNLNQYIIEKLVLNKTSIKDETNHGFTLDELRHDYEEVYDAYSKSDKEPYQQKYGVKSNKKEDIMRVIANHLRSLRQTKTTFDEQDIRDFWKLSLNDSERYSTGLEDEPIDFLVYLLKYLKDDMVKHKECVFNSVTGKAIHKSPESPMMKYHVNRYNKILDFVNSHS